MVRQWMQQHPQTTMSHIWHGVAKGAEWSFTLLESMPLDLLAPQST
jgi:hypothetical protein